MALISAITISCSTNGEKRGSGNPLLEEPTAKYGIIDYDRITPEHFSEAIELGMEEQKREVKDICENPEEPTFRNTIAALDQSGQLLSKSVLIFEDLTSSNSTPELEALQTKYSPALTAHNDGIYLNPQLFDRVKTVYDKHYKMGIEQPEAEKEILNHEEMSVLRKTYEAFAKRGAELGEEQKAQLRELNARISALQTKFSQNLLHETNNTYVTVDSKEELDGLPEANIQRAADMARQQGPILCSNIAPIVNCVTRCTMPTITVATRATNGITRPSAPSSSSCASNAPNCSATRTAPNRS